MSKMFEKHKPCALDSSVGRKVYRLAVAGLLMLLATTTATLAQFEKTVLVDAPSWREFYSQPSDEVPEIEGFRPYNIVFEYVSQSGISGDYLARIGGVQIRSTGEESWVVGPMSENELVGAAYGNRILDIEKVNQIGLEGGGPLYLAVLTNNTGSQYKSWRWLHDVTLAEIQQFALENDFRPIDLEILDFDSYAAILISNTGDDERQVTYGTEATENHINSLVAWGAESYRLVHLGYEGNSAGDGGIYWNYILEKTDTVKFAQPVFDFTKADLTSLADAWGHRISMIDFNKYTGLYAAILVEELD